jgi:hypothetical protein
MELPEASDHSFVVRLWLEERQKGSGDAIWRGHITHIPGGEQRYVKNLNEILDFISSYIDIEMLDARPAPRVRLQRWLKMIFYAHCLSRYQ